VINGTHSRVLNACTGPLSHVSQVAPTDATMLDLSGHLFFTSRRRSVRTDAAEQGKGGLSRLNAVKRGRVCGIRGWQHGDSLPTSVRPPLRFRRHD